MYIDFRDKFKVEFAEIRNQLYDHKLCSVLDCREICRAIEDVIKSLAATASAKCLPQLWI